MKKKSEYSQAVSDGATGTTEIWDDYQKGLEYINSINLKPRIEDSWRFYAGDQWEGIEAGGEKLPQLNFIKPMVKYQIAVVSQYDVQIDYSPLGKGNENSDYIYRAMNQYAAKQWEKMKMDSKTWEVALESCITGTAFVYFYDDNGQTKMELINGTNIFLADEQNRDIQTQPYILITRREYVADVRKEAEAKGISEDQISLILPDTDTGYEINGETEVKNEQKCITVMKLYRADDGIIHMAKSTKTVLYYPDVALQQTAPEANPEMAVGGMKLYPVAIYAWNTIPGQVRGLGDVYDKIPNQVEVNKAISRLFIASKTYCFPHIAYDSDKITQDAVKAFSTVGSSLAFRNLNGQDIGNYIKYLQPAQINNLAQAIVTDTIAQTRELAGAGEMVTGSVNPERASGAAIVAAQDSAKLPLNMQISHFRQFCEDIASIWWDMYCVYNTEPLTYEVQDENGQPMQVSISPDAIAGELVQTSINTSPNDRTHRAYQDEMLLNLFNNGAITLEEFAYSLDEDSNIPHKKLAAIAQNRTQGQIAQLTAMVQQLQAENQQLNGVAKELAQGVKDVEAEIPVAEQRGIAAERANNEKAMMVEALRNINVGAQK